MIQINKLYRPCWESDSRYRVLVGGAGSGKCLAYGTEVLMADGSTKNAEDVRVGDELMGPDSTPRTVQSTHHGESPLYEVRQNGAALNYTVTEDHILHLKQDAASLKEGRYGEVGKESVTVKERLEQSDRRKLSFKGYRVPVEYPEQEVTVEPYYLGLWLGDGKSRANEITTADQEVVEFLQSYAFRLGIDFKKKGEKGEAAMYSLANTRGETHYIPKQELEFLYWTEGLSTRQIADIKGCSSNTVKNHMKEQGVPRRGRKEAVEHARGSSAGDLDQYGWLGETGGVSNPLREAMTDMGMWLNKHIPENYQRNSRQVRLDLLAGIIDADGHLSGNCFEVTQKSERLAKDIRKLAWGLGFRCSMGEKEVTIGSGDETRCYYRMHISGNTHEIPTRIERKQVTDYSKNKDPFIQGVEVVPAGHGKWAGFELDGDKLHLLPDGTVLHNSVNVAQRMIDTAGTHENARVLTIRKVARTCRHSTFQLYKDVLNATNRRSEVSIREQPMEIHFDGGGSILHAGLDDEQKLKSISGITHIWVEEATELDFPDEDAEEADLAQLDLRLRGVPKNLDPNITLTFNPVKDASDIYEYLNIFEEDVPYRDWAELSGVYVQHTVKDDNPWVGEDYMQAFERLDGSMHTIYVEGRMARSDDPDQVIPYKYVQRGRDLEPEGGTQTMGVDVARFGSDDTVLCRVEGNAAHDFDSHSGLDTSRISTVVQEAVKNHGIPWGRVGVDAVGIGAGVVDQLPRDVVSVKAGSSPVQYKDRTSEYDFYNLRSQLWWTIREALKDYRLALPDPPSDLVEDLCAPRYDFRGKKMEVRVEPKEDIKKRLGRSPDYADALGIGWALTELEIADTPQSGGIVFA